MFNYLFTFTNNYVKIELKVGVFLYINQRMIILLRDMNEYLKSSGVHGEICIYGGAIMCIALNARYSTHDIDAIFNPPVDVRKSASVVGELNGLSGDWLNDAVKGFVSVRNELLLSERLSNLTIYVASPEYMFAMKCLSMRLDNENEVNDIKFLLKFLRVSTLQQAEAIIYKFYPQRMVLPRTFYFLEELLGG